MQTIMELLAIIIKIGAVKLPFFFLASFPVATNTIGSYNNAMSGRAPIMG